MRNALVHRQFEHLGVDHDQAHLLRRGLVQQRQHHGVDRDRFTRAGRSGHQQMRHARQIDHHRVAADVLAQGQGDRRTGLVVILGHEDLGQADHLAMLVGDLQADDRFAGDDFHHAHADGRQRAGQILGEVGDLTDLHAGPGLQFETRDHRPRIDRDNLHLDAEIGELQFQLPRHGLQRGGRIAFLAGLRLVEQRQRRQLGLRRRFEQMHLPFLLDTVADHDALQHRLDAWRQPRLDAFLFDLHHLFALHARPATRQPHHQHVIAVADFRDQHQGQTPGGVHHAQPGQAGEQGDAGQEQGQHEQGGAEETEGLHQMVADQVAEYPAGIGRQRAGRHGEVQRRQTAARAHGQDKAHPAQAELRRLDILDRRVAVKGQPGAVGDHDGKQVGEITEQTEQHIGQPGPDHATDIADRRHRTGVRPTRVHGVVTDQGQQQVQRHRADHQQQRLAQATGDVRDDQRNVGTLAGRLSQMLNLMVEK